MNPIMMATKRAIFAMVLACLLLSACAPQGVAVSNPSPTLALDPTATSTTAPTHTPEPTATTMPTATSTATPEPTATATPNRTATAVAMATASAEAMLAVIEPDLKTYGFETSNGHLAWFSDEEYKVTAKSYDDFEYKKLEAAGAHGNFIFHTEITWESKGGLAGCGVVFRSEEDMKLGKQAHFGIIRLENAPAWDVEFRQKGLYQYSISKWTFTSDLFDRPGSTNKISLIVNGQNITPYINGRKQHLVEDTKLKEGWFGLSAWQESGETTCTYNNTWIWAIDKP